MDRKLFDFIDAYAKLCRYPVEILGLLTGTDSQAAATYEGVHGFGHVNVRLLCDKPVIRYVYHTYIREKANAILNDLAISSMVDLSKVPSAVAATIERALDVRDYMRERDKPSHIGGRKWYDVERAISDTLLQIGHLENSTDMGSWIPGHLELEAARLIFEPEYGSEGFKTYPIATEGLLQTRWSQYLHDAGAAKTLRSHQPMQALVVSGGFLRAISNSGYVPKNRTIREFAMLLEEVSQIVQSVEGGTDQQKRQYDLLIRRVTRRDIRRVSGLTRYLDLINARRTEPKVTDADWNIFWSQIKRLSFRKGHSLNGCRSKELVLGGEST